MNVLKRSFLLIIISILFTAVMVACGGDEGSEEASTTNTDENDVTEETNEPSEEEEGESDSDSESEAETMDPVTLSLADFAPAPHPIQREIFPEWAAAIEEATDGLVTIEMYPGGSLLGSGDIYPGVESGLADIGHDVSGYNPGRLPVLNSLYSGGLEYRNSAVSSHVAKDVVEQLNPEELQDTEIMFIYGIAPGLLMTSEPVRSLEDLEGMQIRASGTNVATLEALGATPVAMPVTEAYESMSRGIVDGSLLPADTLRSFNLAEVTNYVTHSSLIYTTINYVTMNKDVWDSFPSHIQEAIREVNEQAFEHSIEVFTREVEDSLQYAIDEHGVEEIFLTEEEEARWLDRLVDMIDLRIEELNDAGLDGEDIMNQLVELTKKYNEELGE
ncbi:MULTISPECIES: TRAP transporter substrate-binding protein [Bacillaceae]|uniref:TRAP transporter substrate-binding protein n=1 Tax=Evansella alkalicola TaxID=745819 RepID=A0ABS6JTR0_9BACI|nr:MULTISPECIES: TRAP transporter substrate-binding protein [Bacillaceae]MBU9721064.1 TRAP transporter substrate-binding protein [Bacillus alkalicola]